MRITRRIAIVILGGALLIAPVVAFAQTAGQSGIQISPLTFNLDIKPGESQQSMITITNLNSAAIDYSLEKENFSGISEQGAPDFSSTDLKEGVTSLSDWISFDVPLDGSLASKESKDIVFTVSIPTGAEPGGHYAAVFAKQVKKTAEGKTELGVSSRVGALLLVSVPGATQKGAQISEFKPQKIVWSGPVDFTMKVKDTGTVHFDSKASVEIKSIFGSIATVDMGTHTILPGAIRDYIGSWSRKYPFGYYKLTATATDGDGNPVTTTAVLWAIPLIIVLPVIALVVIIILAIRYVKSHFKIVTK